jgi:hypothetical protein
MSWVRRVRRPDSRFEDSAHAERVLALCLLGRQLALNALRCLHGSVVLDLGCLSALEELTSVCIHSYNSVRFVQVDTHRHNAIRNIAAGRVNSHKPTSLI